MSWWALAMVFASLPGICFVGYCYVCGYFAQRCTFRGYIHVVKNIYKAKDEGLKKTSRVLAGRQAPIFYFCLIIILLIIAKDTLLVVAVNLASIPAGRFAFWFGKRNRLLDGVHISDAEMKLFKLTPQADFRLTIAIFGIMGLWVAVVALTYGLFEKLMK